MANKDGNKRNQWNLQEMQETLVKETENRITEGFEQIAEGSRSAGEQPLSDHDGRQQAAGRTQQKPATNPADLVEPTKGVQTYLTVTRYRQLSDIKLKRGKGATIGSLAAEAICDWLDRQQAVEDGGK